MNMVKSISVLYSSCHWDFTNPNLSTNGKIDPAKLGPGSSFILQIFNQEVYQGNLVRPSVAIPIFAAVGLDTDTVATLDATYNTFDTTPYEPDLNFNIIRGIKISKSGSVITIKLLKQSANFSASGVSFPSEPWVEEFSFTVTPYGEP